MSQVSKKEELEKVAREKAEKLKKLNEIRNKRKQDTVASASPDAKTAAAASSSISSPSASLSTISDSETTASALLNRNKLLRAGTSSTTALKRTSIGGSAIPSDTSVDDVLKDLGVGLSKSNEWGSNNIATLINIVNKSAPLSKMEIYKNLQVSRPIEVSIEPKVRTPII